MAAYSGAFCDFFLSIVHLHNSAHLHNTFSSFAQGL